MYYLRKEPLKTQWKYYCDNPFVYYKEMTYNEDVFYYGDTIKEAFEKYIVKNQDNCLEYPWEHNVYEENIRWAEEELKKLKENKNEE